MTALDAWPQYIEQYGYLAVFLLSVVEGPVATVFAAFLASQGMLLLAPIYAIVIVGDLIGDALYYAVGRFVIGRLPWPKRRRAQVLRRRVEALQDHIRDHAGRVLLFGKLTHSLGFAVLLAAGSAKVRFDSFLLYNLLGALPKSAVLLVVGYFFGRFYKSLSGDFRVAALVGFVILILFLIPYIHRLTTPRGSEGTE